MHSIPIAEDDAPPALAEPAIDLSSDLRGRVLSGRHELAELFCHGELGSVYLGHDQHSGRPVEIKILAPDAATPAAVERFRERSRRMLGLSHPGIAAVYAEGITENGLPFVVTEHREGRNLHHMHGDSRLAWPAPEAIVRQLGEALAALHAAGVVHGAVSPGNIVWVEDGPRSPQVQLVDREFRSATPDADAAASLGALRSTPGAGSELDAGVDLYALGAVVHELCTGKLPDAPDAPPDMRQADTQITVPPGFEAVILALVDRDPGNRPNSALAVLDLLDRSTASAMDADDLDFLAALGESPTPPRFAKHPPPSQPMPRAQPLPPPATFEPPAPEPAPSPIREPAPAEEVAPALFVLDDPAFSPGGSLPSQHADPVEPPARAAVAEAVAQAPVAEPVTQAQAPAVAAATAGPTVEAPARPEPPKQRIKPHDPVVHAAVPLATPQARPVVPVDDGAGRRRTIFIVIGVIALAIVFWQIQAWRARRVDPTPTPPVVVPTVTQPPAKVTAPPVVTPVVTPPTDTPPATAPIVAPETAPPAAPATTAEPGSEPALAEPGSAAPPTDTTPPAGDATLPEQLSAQEFRRLMLRSNRSNAVRTCYRRHARPGEEEVAIVARVSPAGRVGKLRLDPEIPLAECLRTVMLGLEFPPAQRSAQHNFIFKNMTSEAE